jgi:hypothetical protein
MDSEHYQSKRRLVESCHYRAKKKTDHHSLFSKRTLPHTVIIIIL